MILDLNSGTTKIRKTPTPTATTVGARRLNVVFSISPSQQFSSFNMNTNDGEEEEEDLHSPFELGKRKEISLYFWTNLVVVFSRCSSV